MLPNGLKFQPIGRDFVFASSCNEGCSVAVHEKHCLFVIINSMKSIQILISFTDCVMGMYRQWLKDTNVCVPTISTQAEWYSVNYMIARNKITHKCQ